MNDRVVPSVLRGDERICLAITEPSAGSDVANLTTTAKLSEDGKHYIVNGEKVRLSLFFMDIQLKTSAEMDHEWHLVRM